MKSGSGSDPFEDSSSSDAADAGTAEPSVPDVEGSQSPIPWYFRRQTVSDGRDAVKQLELREETLDELDRGVGNLARRVGLSKGDSAFYTTDAREAILLAGIENLDDAAEKLREWGYDRVEAGGGD